MKGLPLRRLGALAARIGFGLTPEAQIPVTLHLAATRDYNAESDTENETSAVVPTTAIKYKRQDMQDQQNLDVRTHTLGIEAAKLNGQDISQTDYVIEPDGRWEIVSCDLDPSGALWQLQVRR